MKVVPDLSAEMFSDCLRYFIARRGVPHFIWSDNGTNYAGAMTELKELAQFLELQKTPSEISSSQWKFIPPKFGWLREAAVKSFTLHFRRVVGNNKITFEGTATAYTQIEAYLNSMPLVPLPLDDDGVEAH